MPDLEVVDVPSRLEEGIRLLNSGEVERSAELFEKYLEANPDSALALSYVGMLKAVREKNHIQGLDHCREALSRDRTEPLCYLNLAKAFLAAGDRYQCVRVLNKGLKIRSPHRPQLVIFYKMIGVRRKPPIRFLARNNMVNGLLGKLTWKLKG